MDVRMCSKCGSPIPRQRLEALPETEVCVACSLERYHTEDEVDLDNGADNYDMVHSVQASKERGD